MQEFARPLHRVDSGLFSSRPNFCGQEEFFSRTQLTRQVADDAFGPAVHWGTIDHFAPELDETRQHFLERARAR